MITNIKKGITVLKKKIKIFSYRNFIYLRFSKMMTNLLGPFNHQNHTIVQMDITYDCNLKCYRCGRQCSQPPTKEHISVKQIEKFISESIEQGRKWDKLRVMGGEPTMHPQLFDILFLLLKYKHSFSPATMIQLETNGFGEKVRKTLSQVPREIVIYNTNKTSPNNTQFVQFNAAPIDFKEFKNLDYSNGCINREICGIGFAPFGYYICGSAGAIDRVFGFDIGRKKLPSIDDMMDDQAKLLCVYCGLFWNHIVPKKSISLEPYSDSWTLVLKNYNVKKPILKLY